MVVVSTTVVKALLSSPFGGSWLGGVCCPGSLAPVASCFAGSDLAGSCFGGSCLVCVDGFLPVLRPSERSWPGAADVVSVRAAALCANGAVSNTQHALAESLLASVGVAQWLDDERLMDAVTALSGSGPAYVFLMVEALRDAGIRFTAT